jgi:hypothetical protein
MHQSFFLFFYLPFFFSFPFSFLTWNHKHYYIVKHSMTIEPNPGNSSSWGPIEPDPGKSLVNELHSY